MNTETPKQAASYGEPDNVRTRELNEADVYSAYLDGDGSLYLFDKNGKDLFGWPKSWPQHIADVDTFCKARDIYLADRPMKGGYAIHLQAPPAPSPQSDPASYGEPWHCESDWMHIRREDTQEIVAAVVLRPTQKNKISDSPTARRIVQCVNACAGIADPDKAFQAAREALEYVLGILGPQARLGHMPQGGESEGNWIHVVDGQQIARAALAQLNNTK
jgi:hypothetical protein